MPTTVIEATAKKHAIASAPLYFIGVLRRLRQNRDTFEEVVERAEAWRQPGAGRSFVGIGRSGLRAPGEP